jgi:hypothetical protein
MPKEVKEAKEEVALNVDELQDGTAVVDLSEEEITDASTGAADDERLTPPVSDEADDEDAAVQAAKELGSARTEGEREVIRERRRQERHDKRDAARAREREKDQRLNELEQVVRSQAEQLGLIQNRNRGTELAQLDAAIKRTQDAETYYKGIIADAVTQQNGAVVADATARLQSVGREQENLLNVRKTFAQAQTRPAASQPVTAEMPDPEMLKHTVAWMNENKWYNPRGNDPETQLVKALDAAVFAEGFKPNSPEYWAELSKRVGANLPNRAKERIMPADTSRKSEQRSVVTGSGRSSAAANGGSKTTFVLSSDRVKALKDAGMWEDPKARSDAIRRFRDYDREHAADTR